MTPCAGPDTARAARRATPVLGSPNALPIMAPFTSRLLAALAAAGLSAVASAQVTVVASETFEYPVPGPFFQQAGGVGWENPWWVSGAANDDLTLFDSSVTPPFTLSDNVGAYAGQVNPFGEAYRKPDAALHPDIAAGGLFGIDNTTIWFSFSLVGFSGQPGEHFGGFALIEQGTGEQLFIGSPWDTNEWGIDDEGPAGPGPVTIAGTDDSVPARLVARLDFLPGMERLRLYVDPSTEYPTGTADLDEMVHDMFFNEIRISSGGNNNDLYYFDNLVIAKGDPAGSVGTNYCGPGAVNSTGASGVIRGLGSASVSTNQLSMEASNLPTSSFGFFLTSQQQSLIPMPGGSQGNLCLGGAIGRYVGPGQILNSGASGSFTLPIDLTQIPQPTGFVSGAVGEAWNFQAWHRDSSGGTATSNFTDGVEVTLTL